MMYKLIFWITGLIFLFESDVNGQCPDKEALQSHIVYITANYIRKVKPPPEEQMAILLGYFNKINDCHWRSDSTHSSLLRVIGRSYFLQADYIKSAQYYRQCIKMITENAGSPSLKMSHLVACYYWLSVCYDSLNNYSEKMRALDSCATVAVRLNYTDRATLKAIESRVEYLFDIGDYHRCIDYALKWEALGLEYAAKNTGEEKDAGKKNVSSSIGWRVKALLRLREFETAETILVGKADEFKREKNKNYLGMTYAQLAEVQELKGNYEKALSYYNASLKYYEEDGDYFNCKQTAKDIGYNIYFRHYGDADKALASYSKALRYINKHKYRNQADSFETMNIFSNIGMVYAGKGVYDSAFKYFQLAFSQVKAGSNEEDILQTTPQEMARFKKNYYLTGLVIDKGDAYLKKYTVSKQQEDIRRALRIYKVADRLLDRFKAEQAEMESKLFWRSDTRRLYENAVEACYLSGNTTDAFYFFEKSRAVLLSDQLNEQRWLGEGDIMQQTQLKKRMLLIKNERDTIERSSARYKELQAALDENRMRLEGLLDNIKLKTPLYYQSFIDSAVISISDVQQKILKNHQALVELFTGTRFVYTLVITPRKINISRVDKPAYTGLTDICLKYISDNELLNKGYTNFIHASGKLYEIIFKNTAIAPGRIIISPDNRYFPFEALVTAKANNSNRYFVEDYAVSYTYSARYLLNQFAGSTAKSGLGNFLGMAPVQFRYAAAARLPALPGSDQSLHRVKNYFSNASIAVAGEASKHNFGKQFFKNRIIQLYTHATDSGVNGEPVIYFADSLLFLSDLMYENKPATSLIVLSACKTGTGKLYEGEGVFSFNRGFAALGIPSAITNLWSVNNESTYQVTEFFYKYLSAGLPTDVALQKAKLEFIRTVSKENSLPYYWAGPVLAGRADVIQLSRPFPWKWAALLSGATMVCLFIWVRRVKRKGAG